MFGYYNNGDGLLLVPTPDMEKKTHGLRMLLSDSGHYLIPINVGDYDKHKETSHFLCEKEDNAEQQYDDLLTYAASGAEESKTSVTFLAYETYIPDVA